jgi:alanyl-tRNA synthetase
MILGNRPRERCGSTHASKSSQCALVGLLSKVCCQAGVHGMVTVCRAMALAMRLEETACCIAQRANEMGMCRAG